MFSVWIRLLNGRLLGYVLSVLWYICSVRYVLMLLCCWNVCDDGVIGMFLYWNMLRLVSMNLF